MKSIFSDKTASNGVKKTEKIPATKPPRIHGASKVGAGTTLKEILENPKAGEILVKNRVPCMSCPYASLELEVLEIGKVCEIYGLDLESILKELNNL